MKATEPRSGLEVEYEKLLNLLSRTGKYLEGLDVDPAVLRSYKLLVRYLRARPAQSLSDIIGEGASRNAGAAQKYELTNDQILSMSIEKVLELASNKGIPRREIERIAIARFGMTRGGLSTLRNRDALVEKLRTLIGNEVTHDSISRAATQQSSAR